MISEKERDLRTLEKLKDQFESLLDDYRLDNYTFHLVTDELEYAIENSNKD